MKTQKKGHLLGLTLLLLFILTVDLSYASAQESPVCREDTYSELMEYISAGPRIPPMYGVPAEENNHAQVRQLCIDFLKSYGYEVEYKEVKAQVDYDYNVVGTLPGTTDEIVYVSAHYDTVKLKYERTGEWCIGADDNGSGVAGALLVAKELALLAKQQGPFKQTLKVACWDREEFNTDSYTDIFSGTRGSRNYLNGHRGENIKISYVFEGIGYYDDTSGSQKWGNFYSDAADIDGYIGYEDENGEGHWTGDFALVSYNEVDYGGGSEGIDAAYHIRQFTHNLSLKSVLMPIEVESTSKLASTYFNRQWHPFCLSDHLPFWMYGYPALMIGNTSSARNPNYHCAEGQDDFRSIKDFQHILYANKIIWAVTFAAEKSLRE